MISNIPTKELTGVGSFSEVMRLAFGVEFQKGSSGVISLTMQQQRRQALLAAHHADFTSAELEAGRTKEEDRAGNKKGNMTSRLADLPQMIR